MFEKYIGYFQSLSIGTFLPKFELGERTLETGYTHDILNSKYCIIIQRCMILLINAQFFSYARSVLNTPGLIRFSSNNKRERESFQKLLILEGQRQSTGESSFSVIYGTCICMKLTLIYQSTKILNLKP